MDLRNLLEITESPEVFSFESDFKRTNFDYCMPEKYDISKEFIKQEYFEKNKSQLDIAKAVGISQWVISHRMKKYGLKTKERTWKIHKRKYSVNDDFFKELNPVNAWVLGWLASDGYVNEQKNTSRFGLKLSKKDSDIVYKIKQLLRYDGQIYYIKERLKKTGKEYEQMHLQITSKKIVKRLKDFGIIKNKTKKLAFPEIIKKINNEKITKSFIQGVFEGDGSVLFDERQKSPCFQIVGTEELLEGIQVQLINYLNVKKTKLTRNTKLGNHFALRYRGRFQAIRIFDWLYSDTNYYLSRKYKKYLEVKRRLS